MTRLISERRDKKKNTLEGKLFAIVRKLVNDNRLAIENGLLWQTVKAALNGEDIPGKSHSCYILEHGQVSQKVITLLVDKFGAKRSHDGNSRLLEFNRETLERLRSTYELPETIELLLEVSGKDSGVFLPEGRQGEKGKNDLPSYPAEEDNKSCLSKSPLESLVPLGKMIPCPYPPCTATFATEIELGIHGVQKHPRKPIMYDFEPNKRSKKMV